jgi:DNA-binding response OmpR family regulator
MVATMAPQKSVLVVEDDRESNRLLSKQLKASGFQVTSAAAVQDCVRYFAEYGLPDLIVLDLELADGYGTDVLNDIAYAQQHPKIVVVSANVYASHIPLTKYEDLIDEVLLKPVSPRGLVALVKNLLSIE